MRPESNSGHSKCSNKIQQICGALNLELDNDTDEMKLEHIYSRILEIKSIVNQIKKHFA